MSGLLFFSTYKMKEVIVVVLEEIPYVYFYAAANQ